MSSSTRMKTQRRFCCQFRPQVGESSRCALQKRFARHCGQIRLPGCPSTPEVTPMDRRLANMGYKVPAASCSKSARLFRMMDVLLALPLASQVLRDLPETDLPETSTALPWLRTNLGLACSRQGGRTAFGTKGCRGPVHSPKTKTLPLGAKLAHPVWRPEPC